MDDYIIITWKDGHVVWIDNDVAEVDAYQVADIRHREHEGDYTTIYTAKDGVLTEINRLTSSKIS